MPVPPPQYRHIIRPSVDVLAQGSSLLLDTPTMATFLGVPPKTVQDLLGQGRIPLPLKLGLSSCRRWNVFELLDWVNAGCPRRKEWIAMRGRSGWYPLWPPCYL